MVVFVIAVIAASVRVLREYERGVVFRLGRLIRTPRGPGLVFLIPLIDRMVRIDLRTVTLTVPPQEVITRDNVPVRVNAVAPGSIQSGITETTGGMIPGDADWGLFAKMSPIVAEGFAPPDVVAQQVVLVNELPVAQLESPPRQYKGAALSVIMERVCPNRSCKSRERRSRSSITARRASSWRAGCVARGLPR